MDGFLAVVDRIQWNGMGVEWDAWVANGVDARSAVPGQCLPVSIRQAGAG
jgi:hypothetical protein